MKRRKKNKRKPADHAIGETAFGKPSSSSEPLTSSFDVPSEASPEMEDSTAAMDADGHGHFRDLCLVYGDFYRPVFLEVIQEWFVRGANKDEIAVLRKAISTRAASAGKDRKQGRPRAQDDSDWLIAAKIAAWRHIVDGWTWWQIAESDDMKPNRSNIKTIERTLSRRVDRYAAVIWRACIDLGSWKWQDDEQSNLARIEVDLRRAEMLRAWLWVKAGLPFGRFPERDLTEGCTKIVLTLAPRGEKADAEENVSRANYRRQTRSKTLLGSVK